MIRISDAAQAHFAKLLANQEEGTQIRVFVINPGTPNAECGVSYCPPDAVEATDTALKFDLLTAYVDELSAPYLEDAEIDFVTDQLGSQLTLKAPNAKMRKVADDAPLMERVEYMLQSQINRYETPSRCLMAKGRTVIRTTSISPRVRTFVISKLTVVPWSM